MSGYPDGMSKDHGPWRDGHRAWGRLRDWQRQGPPGRPADDGERALATLADVGMVRRLLDEVELTAVRAGRQHGRSWAEIATKLGVSRQSAWERWRELDGPQREDLTAVSEPIAAAATEIVGAAATRRQATVVVPNVVGLSWVEARDLLIAHQLVGGIDPASSMSSTLELPGTVIDQSPESGARVAPGSMVTLWLRPDEGGSAGVREPRRPRPDAEDGPGPRIRPERRGGRLMAARSASARSAAGRQSIMIYRLWELT